MEKIRIFTQGVGLLSAAFKVTIISGLGYDLSLPAVDMVKL